MSEATLSAAVEYDTSSHQPANFPHPSLAYVPYTAVAKTSTKVPDGTLASASISLGLGSLATAVNGFLLVNRSRQDLQIAINGDTVSWSLPSGGVMLVAGPATGTNAITAIDVVATATQSGDGFVDLIAFGS